MAECHRPSSYRRRPTRAVRIGALYVGGDHPIRVQSMTTPPTTDTAATVAQIARLAEAGCEIVRVTVPTSADAANLPSIRRALAERGLSVPLVADIHFTPAAAMKAVEHVDKIRVNPGNYADKKRFAVREYTDDEYGAELERIERAFSPLVRRCRELGVAMRIGTNHGSLSDRIMNRYGDTAEGMVESALEFVRICEAHGLRDLVVSMKASNPRIVLEAYRLLVRRMSDERMDYPLHLGVTEAGDGEDARIKSAIGIGALLDEGIGDTVRVSLTEDPVREIPVARALVSPYNARPAGGSDAPWSPGGAAVSAFERRSCREVAVGPRRLGGRAPVLVEACLLSSPVDEGAVRREIDAQVGPRVPEETRAELVSVSVSDDDDVGAVKRLRGELETVCPRVAVSARLLPELAAASARRLSLLADAAHRVHVRWRAPASDETLRKLARLMDATEAAGSALLVEASSSSDGADDVVDLALTAARTARDRGHRHLMLALDASACGSPLRSTRTLAARLADEGLDDPLVLVDRPAARRADPLLAPSSGLGGLLCEGIGDAVHVESASAEDSRRLAFGILQASRVRITRTEFISCPSCGRTLFDLEETTARIKRRTAHLKGVKIAVMGCVVNGPGEMADADFGYVGWGEDRIALFVGKNLVSKDIPADEADERLVELIKRHGRWVDPPVPVPDAT